MAKDKEVEITKVKLNLGGKEIELTVEQARKLKAALDDLFGKEVIRECHSHAWWYYPQYTYICTTPTIIAPVKWPGHEITCGSTTFDNVTGSLTVSM